MARRRSLGVGQDQKSEWRRPNPRLRFGLGRVDSHAERDKGGNELGEGQEVTRRFLVACGHAAVVFEAIDQPLNEIPTLVLLTVVPPLNDTVFQRWNDRLGVSLPQ